MAVDPGDVHDISIATVQLYRDTELRLLNLVAAFLRRGIDTPGWLDERLAAVTALRHAAQLALGELELNAAQLIRDNLAEAYRTGYGAALTAAELAQLAPDIVDAAQAAGAVVNRTAAVESLAVSAIRDFGERSSNVARHVVDVYRAVILKASALSIAGGLTRRQASQSAFQAFVDRGVTSFTDSAGRQWRLSSYVEMALRTVTQRAAVQGQTDRLQSLGLDLVIISNSPGECPRCRPWEGKVLSITGASVGKVKTKSLTTGRTVTVTVAASLPAARAAGLFHPNCTHTARAFLPGATQIPTGDLSDPEHHAAKEQQRYLERGIRRWKERAETAITPDAEIAARRKVRAWQKELRDHLEANPRLKRLRYREQIGAGNLPEGVMAFRQGRGAVGIPGLDNDDDLFGGRGPGGSGSPGIPGLGGFPNLANPNPAGGVPADLPIRTALAEAPDTISVEIALGREIQRLTGHTVPVNFGPDADVDTAREHAEGILRVLERYPSIGLLAVDWNDSRSGGIPAEQHAQAGAGVIKFNLAWATSARRAEYLRVVQAGAVWTDTRPGWHPRNSGTLASTSIHEMAHLLHETAGEAVTRDVAKLVAELAQRDGVLADDLIARQVSRYSNRSIEELIAEAVTDVLLNGDRASELSTGIVAILDARYARLGGRIGRGDGSHPTGAEPDVPGRARPYHLHIDDIEDLAEDVEEGTDDPGVELAGGMPNITRLVTLRSGRKVVRKRSPSSRLAIRKRQADAEQLGSVLARAFGLRAPRIYRTSDDVVWMDYIDAPSVARAYQDTPLAQIGQLADRAGFLIASDEGRIAGLVDLMLENNDRHAGNWLLTDQPVLIDHGMAFGPYIPTTVAPPFVTEGDVPSLFLTTTRGPFALHYVTGATGTRHSRWRPNELTKADIAELRARLDRLGDVFDHLGRLDWLRHARDVLDAIEPYATGTRNLIAGR